MLSTMPMSLYYDADKEMKVLSIGGTGWDKTHFPKSRCHNRGVNWVRVWLCCGDDGVDGMRWGGVDGLPFWSQISSSESATSDMPVF